MPAIPATTIRNNLGTWAVPPATIPAVAAWMTKFYPREAYDPDFYGQYLQTTYFDTCDFDLRKARIPKKRYLTLRLRAYHPAASAGGDYPPARYALSVKTEDKKQRWDINTGLASALLTGPTIDLFGGILSPDLFSRLLALTNNQPLHPVVTVCSHRFAVETKQDRLTLDVDTQTDIGRHYHYGILEFKSMEPEAIPDALYDIPGLRPVKASKFLWATSET